MPMLKDNAIKRLLLQQKNSKFPQSLNPMLATLVDKPFDTPGWMYEVKWDGYRAIAFMKNGNVELSSRNTKSFNDKFYPIYQELQKFNLNAVIDGEIVSIDQHGVADFGSLQGWRSEADGELVYYVFDILWYDGKSLAGMPLKERREILKSVLPASEMVKISANFETNGVEFFKLAEEMSLEGIMAKKEDSLYYPGTRSKDWLKIKTQQRQEVVIGGFTQNEGSSKDFSALLVGVYENSQLVYTGKIGTGFTQKLQRQMMEKFRPLITSSSPFSHVPDINKPSRFRPDPPKAVATWLKPEIICEVSFREMTGDGVMRHPSFEGLRDDKEPSEILLEKETDTRAIVKKKSTLNKQKIIPAAPQKSRRSLLNPSEETQVRKINGHDVKFTNLSKIFWPVEKFTKRDLINYYYQAAPFILPYLKNRPQSLNRFPNGINGKSFYQKDVTGKVPDWIKTFPYHSNVDGDKNFMMISDEASLLYLVSLGCIEINPWSSTAAKPDNPDWCIIDLDPDKNSFEQVIKAANITKQVLDSIGVPSYPKTSGSTGIHIYIPFGAKYSYEDSKEFGRSLMKIVHAEIPDFTSIERKTADRKGCIYLDFLQNRPQATVAAPYSLRPKPGVPVSTPLDWSKLKKG